MWRLTTAGPPAANQEAGGGAWDGINEEEAQCDEDDEDATPRTRTGLTEYTHTHDTDGKQFD